MAEARVSRGARFVTLHNKTSLNAFISLLQFLQELLGNFKVKDGNETRCMADGHFYAKSLPFSMCGWYVCWQDNQAVGKN